MEADPECTFSACSMVERYLREQDEPTVRAAELEAVGSERNRHEQNSADRDARRADRQRLDLGPESLSGAGGAEYNGSNEDIGPSHAGQDCSTI